MKILLWGNAKSTYIKHYVKYVLCKKSDKICLTYNEQLDPEEKMFYQDHGVKLINIFQKKGLLKNIPKLSTFTALLSNLSKYTRDERFDYLHIHFVGNNSLMKFAAPFLKRYCKKIILTFWGSDILDIDQKQANLLVGVLNLSNKIVLSTVRMKEQFQSYFGHKYDQKIVQCLFGNTLISRIVELKQHNINLEELFKNNVEYNNSLANSCNLPRNKYIISIGYSGAPRHQHKLVLEAISVLPDFIKKRIFCVCQMGYGVIDEKYPAEILSLMQNYNLQGKIITKWLSPEETIRFKLQVDLFIHAQLTDALSSSVLEYIYLDRLVFNPSWITYAELEELGCKYIEYKSFSELPELIMKAMHGTYKDMNNEAKSIIEEKFSWQSLSDCWKKLYD